MPVQITESAIQRAIRDLPEKGRHDLADSGLPGLRLRLTPKGAKTWALACRDREGRMRRFPLGTYPHLSISAAREAARKLRVDVRAGSDPIVEARRLRAIGRDAQDGIGTLQALLDHYGRKPKDNKQAGPGFKLKSWAKQRQTMDKVFAKHLTRPIETMRAADLQMTADNHASALTAANAVRCLRPVLKWASRHHYAPSSLADVHPPAIVQRRDRVLTSDELKAVLKALQESGRPAAACMRLMLLTATRREEAAQVRWRDIDCEKGTWTIPSTKNGRPHQITLSRQAAELLTARKPAKPEPDELVFATPSGGVMGNWHREGLAVMEASGTKGWTRHDLRRTSATLLGELGTPPHVIEAVLNHADIGSRLAGIYNKHRYQTEAAAALQMLADRLDGIAQGGADIVPLRAAG